MSENQYLISFAPFVSSLDWKVINIVHKVVRAENKSDAWKKFILQDTDEGYLVMLFKVLMDYNSNYDEEYLFWKKMNKYSVFTDDDIWTGGLVASSNQSRRNPGGTQS